MSTRLTFIFVLVIAVTTGCRDRAAEAEKARQEAEAKARAEAAKKEMQALPKAFRNPDYFKKNEPAKPEPKAAETEKSPSP